MRQKPISIAKTAVTKFAAMLICSAAIGAETSPDNCLQEPNRDCIASAAIASLDKINNDIDWITGATEIATALPNGAAEGRGGDLVNEAYARALTLAEADVRSNALIEIVNAAVAVGDLSKVTDALSHADTSAKQLENENKRWDVIGKIAVARATSGDTQAALAATIEFPQTNDTLAAYKARTLHDIAPLQAQNGNLSAAVKTLASIDMGIAYYHAVANADVATFAADQDASDLSKKLLDEAEQIARQQEDGYFIAGALRQIGSAYANIGESVKAQHYFADALDGARRADAPQKIARALSRVATAMADAGQYDNAAAAIPAAIEAAEKEETDGMQYWAYYEIAGAAAFAGDIQVAMDLLRRIPSDFAFFGRPLRASTERDIAWGLARHGHVRHAFDVANNIATPRERIQALSRIVRVIDNPDMIALPRYL